MYLKYSINISITTILLLMLLYLKCLKVPIFDNRTNVEINNINNK